MDDDIARMSPEQRKREWEEAVENGIHTGPEPPAEGTWEPRMSTGGNHSSKCAELTQFETSPGKKSSAGRKWLVLVLVGAGLVWWIASYKASETTVARI